MVYFNFVYILSICNWPLKNCNSTLLTISSQYPILHTQEPYLLLFHYTRKIQAGLHGPSLHLEAISYPNPFIHTLHCFKQEWPMAQGTGKGNTPFIRYLSLLLNYSPSKRRLLNVRCPLLFSLVYLGYKNKTEAPGIKNRSGPMSIKARVEIRDHK